MVQINEPKKTASKTLRRIDAVEAVRRVRIITPMLGQDVSTSSLSHIVLEAANRLIPKGLSGTYTPFANIYHAGQNALALKLAMDLARIFDLSESDRFPPEEQDKASVPVLGALLKRSDVQEILVHEAGSWVDGVGHITPSSAPPGVLEAALNSLQEKQRSTFRENCSKALSDFLAIAQRLETAGSKENDALIRIRQFRNRRLAHSLFNKKPDELPKYADLDLLLGVAKDAYKYASLAVEGLNKDFDSLDREDCQRASGYYACVLDGLKREARKLSGGNDSDPDASVDAEESVRA